MPTHADTENSAPPPAGLHRGRRCIIHIGMHKTGSSSIQRSLSRMDDDRFLYPRLGGRYNHSLPIYCLFASEPERHHLLRASRPEEITQYKASVAEDLARSIAALEGRTLLISGEDISTLPEADLPSLKSHFERYFDVTIVGYVRPPAAFMASVFQQGVKNGREKFAPPRLYRNYRSLFGKFDQTFERDNVRLYKFDANDFPDRCVVQHFCTQIGFRFAKDKIVRVNDSISVDAVAALYTYVKYREVLGASKLKPTEGARLAALLKGDKLRFSPDIVRPILEQNRSDLEWIELRLGESLREELGEPRRNDVHDEADLIRPNPGVVATLLQRLGSHAPAGVRGETPEEVATLVHALRQQAAEIAPQVPPRRRRRSTL